MLQAIWWVAEAWRCVAETIIKKCFRKAGILCKDFSLAKPKISADTDLFCDIDVQEFGEDNDDDTEVDELFSQISSEKVLSLSEMLSAEEEIVPSLPKALGVRSSWLHWAQKIRKWVLITVMKMRMICMLKRRTLSSENEKFDRSH